MILANADMVPRMSSVVRRRLAGTLRRAEVKSATGRRRDYYASFQSILVFFLVI
jgi:hypothetical protein